MTTLGSRTLKIFLMTRNEFGLLEEWIKYHGFLFGLENIHVLDGSDDPRIFAIYDKYTAAGLNVHHSTTGLNGLAAELSGLMRAQRDSNSFLIKLDTDEFLAYTRPALLRPRGRFQSALQRHYLTPAAEKNALLAWCSNTLVDRKHRDKALCNTDFGHFLAELPVTGQRYKASLTRLSVPRVEEPPRVCRDLTEFTPLLFTHFKTFFHSASFLSVDLGSHEGTSTVNEGVIDTGLTVIHYQNTSVDDAMRRARQVLVSHRYIDEQDTPEVQRRKLVALQKKGSFPSFHKVDLYLKHLEARAAGSTIAPESLDSWSRKNGPAGPMTLVRDTLMRIDQSAWLRSRRRDTASAA